MTNTLCHIFAWGCFFGYVAITLGYVYASEADAHILLVASIAWLALARTFERGKES